MSVAFDDAMCKVLPMVRRILDKHAARLHDVQRGYMENGVGVPQPLGVDDADMRSGWVPFRIVQHKLNRGRPRAELRQGARVSMQVCACHGLELLLGHLGDCCMTFAFTEKGRRYDSRL